MNQFKSLFNAVFLSSLFATGIYAQEATVTTGGGASSSDGSVEYTIGLAMYTTDFGSDGSTAQGVQHAYEVVVASVQEHNGISIECSVYPNPTTDHLILDVGNYPLTALSYQLFDARGRVISAENLSANQSIISMEDLEPSYYLLNVMADNKVVTSFKIIKR